MYVTLTLCILLFLVVWTYLTDSRPPLFGVYTQPSRLHCLKKAVFRWILTRRKRHGLKCRVNGQSAGYGVRSSDSVQDMDKPQPLSESHPKAVDAVYFNGFNKLGYYFVAAVARRHGQLAQTLLYIRIPDLGMLELPCLPNTSLYTDTAMAYSAGGLNITVIEAMKRWSLIFSGILRLVKEDGGPVEVDVTFDLLWSATTPVFYFDTDIDPDAMAEAIAREPWTRKFFTSLKQAHQTHYEQFGTITGSVNVNSSTYDLNVTGVRDHSYGNVRDWSDLHRYAIQYIVLEDGTSICVGNICMKPTLTRLIIGYVFHPNGTMNTVSWTDLELHKVGEDGHDPDNISFSFRAGPDVFRVRCHVKQCVIFYMGDNWEGRIHERMSTFVVSGKKGWGISEWDYCNKGGKNNIFKR